MPTQALPISMMYWLRQVRNLLHSMRIMMSQSRLWNSTTQRKTTISQAVLIQTTLWTFYLKGISTWQDIFIQAVWCRWTTLLQLKCVPTLMEHYGEWAKWMARPICCHITVFKIHWSITRTCSASVGWRNILEKMKRSRAGHQKSGNTFYLHWRKICLRWPIPCWCMPRTTRVIPILWLCCAARAALFLMGMADLTSIQRRGLLLCNGS